MENFRANVLKHLCGVVSYVFLYALWSFTSKVRSVLVTCIISSFFVLFLSTLLMFFLLEQSGWDGTDNFFSYRKYLVVDLCE